MQKPPTPRAFRHWLQTSGVGMEIAYTSEAIRDEELMEIARDAAEAGRVVLFRRRLNGELVMIARTLSGKAKRFLKAANAYEPPQPKDASAHYISRSPRGLERPAIPDGYDGPASRSYQPTIGKEPDDVDA